MANPNTSLTAIPDPVQPSLASASLPLDADPFARILGHSAALRDAIARARTVARVDSSVLISGESGAGKELIARGIHESSPRARAPFVALNCATLAESLQASTLFGHAKGAFTGALRDQPGLFEAAREGTLFLDEVAGLVPSAQAAMLRVLQEGVITRIGEHRERKVDVRLITATHRDLDDAIQAGTFRADLFFRLNVVGITVPALRERDDDVLLLARRFIEEFNPKMNRMLSGLSAEVSQLFLAYDWPGNVRELRNAVESAVLLARGDLIQIDDLPACLVKRLLERDSKATIQPETAPRRSDWKQKIVTALAKTGGRRSRTATLLGVSRTTLWRKMKELGLND